MGGTVTAIYKKEGRNIRSLFLKHGGKTEVTTLKINLLKIDKNVVGEIKRI